MFDQCLYFNTTALARQLEREWSVAFKPFELTPPQAFMLRAVLDRPGLPQCDLADALAIARPTATRALDGLAAKGLIERRHSAGDGRESVIHPTAAACKLKLGLNQASAQVTARLKLVLGAGAFSNAVASVKQVRAALV
ncbi:MAG: MarR family transcriptional regulator [Pseudomonadota bacterium]